MHEAASYRSQDTGCGINSACLQVFFFLLERLAGFSFAERLKKEVAEKEGKKKESKEVSEERFSMEQKPKHSCIQCEAGWIDMVE